MIQGAFETFERIMWSLPDTCKLRVDEDMPWDSTETDAPWHERLRRQEERLSTSNSA